MPLAPRPGLLEHTPHLALCAAPIRLWRTEAAKRRNMFSGAIAPGKSRQALCGVPVRPAGRTLHEEVLPRPPPSIDGPRTNHEISAPDPRPVCSTGLGSAPPAHHRMHRSRQKGIGMFSIRDQWKHTTYWSLGILVGAALTATGATVLISSSGGARAFLMALAVLGGSGFVLGSFCA